MLTETNAAEKQGEDFNNKNEGEWTRKVESSTWKKFLAVGEACDATFLLTPRFKRRTFVSSGFSTEGTLISASTVPHWLTSVI